MLKNEARTMLGLAFGSGDLVDKLNEMLEEKDEKEFTIEDGDEIMDWISEELDDESERDEYGDIIE